METIRTYETDEEWCEYIEHDKMIFASAHTSKKTYSRRLMKEMKLILAIKGEIVTELSYNYLIKFYSRHFDIESLGNNFYKIKDIKWEQSQQCG